MLRAVIYRYILKGISIPVKACNMLKSRGVVILPVYVGNRASVSQLSHIAETQFTGMSWVVQDSDRWLVSPHESF